jgi:uncharacterized SAM-binding protein YcdF (DUF218 family)
MRLGRAIRICGYGALLVAVAFVAGFAYFTAQIPKQHSEPAGPADGIVVLTGAASRITDAVELLSAGYAKRLLITGVYPGTSRHDLHRQIPNSQFLFECCIDIGRSALNTVGNAAEARDWARGLGFTSLIVVTSNYHLPRSLSEFSRAMPEIALVPYPVVPEAFRERDWWRDGEAWRMLLVEYVKFIASTARQTFVDPSTGYATASARRPDKVE